jgi:hypothetical protein
MTALIFSTANLALGLALITAAVAVGGILFLQIRRGWIAPLFTVSLLATIIAAWLPGILAGHELGNPDESQLIAGTLTFLKDPVPWRSADMSTAGPLDVLRPEFPAVRMVAALLAAGALLLGYRALAPYGPVAPLQLATAAGAFFYAGMQDVELFQYSTETVPSFLVVLGAYLLLRTTQGGTVASSSRGAALLGLVCGGMVMAKLQSAPPALWLLLCTAWLSRPVRGNPAGWKPLASLAGGFLVLPGLLALTALVCGVAFDAWQGYAMNNVHYVQSHPADSGGYKPQFVWGLNYLLKPAYLSAGLGVLWAGWRAEAGERRRIVILAGLYVAVLVAIVVPQRDTRHYWLFAPVSAVLALGACLQPAWRMVLASRISVRAVAIALALLLFIPPVWHRLRTDRAAALQTEFQSPGDLGEISAQIRARARTGDSLVVWGWRPALHEMTQLPQGMRDAHSQWMLTESPFRSYYQARGLRDFLAHRPRFFAEAVSPENFAFHDRSLYGFETFPALRAIIASDYRFVGEWNGVRLYVRTSPGPS